MQSEEILENLPRRGKSLNFVRGDAQKMGNLLKKKKKSTEIGLFTDYYLPLKIQLFSKVSQKHF